MKSTRKTTTRRRKPGAKAPGRKRKTKVAATPTKTKVIGGERFTKVACGLTKPEASKRATNHRKKSVAAKARVVKNTAGKGYCIYARG